MISYSHSAHYYPAYLPVQLHIMMINMRQKKLKVFLGLQAMQVTMLIGGTIKHQSRNLYLTIFRQIRHSFLNVFEHFRKSHFTTMRANLQIKSAIFGAKIQIRLFGDVLYIQVSFVWPLSIVLQSRMDLIDSWDLLSKCILTKKSFIQFLVKMSFHTFILCVHFL